MLTGDSVGTTLWTRNPAFARSGVYSAAVRSWPPGITSITMSKIFPGCVESSGGKRGRAVA
jgi:hypothetical protein